MSPTPAPDPNGVEIWNKQTQLIEIKWDQIAGVELGWRNRLTSFQKVRDAGDFPAETRDQTNPGRLANAERQSKRATIPHPVLEIHMREKIPPLAFSVTGRSPHGPRRRALRHVHRTVRTLQDNFEGHE